MLLDVGENHVELLRPLGEDTPVGKFLAKRGPGLHHVAYQVRRHRGDAGGAARGRRCALIDEAPRTGIRGSRVAFLHPRASGGVLTEIVAAGGGPRTDATHAGMRRSAIGFQGGQVLSLRVTEESSARCARRCRRGELARDRGRRTAPCVLDLGQVVYLRVETDEHRVGF